MAYGVEEFNADTAWARFKAGFSNDQSNDYNKPPELRFTNGITPNAAKLMGPGSPSMKMVGPGAPYMARKDK